jgi:uncharacterized radical SAM superfamily protein
VSTLQLLEREIQKNKYTIEILHLQLVDIIDIIEKNEYINKIEDLQSDNEDYLKSIKILDSLND